MSLKFTSSLSLLLITLSLIAIPATKAAAADECDYGSSVQRHECTAAILVIADQELNKVYQAIKQRLDTIGLAGTFGAAEAQEQSLRLVKAQRAWITFRDAECELQGSTFLGGMGQGSVVTQCHLEMTRTRVQVLKDLGF